MSAAKGGAAGGDGKSASVPAGRRAQLLVAPRKPTPWENLASALHLVRPLHDMKRCLCAWQPGAPCAVFGALSASVGAKPTARPALALCPRA